MAKNLTVIQFVERAKLIHENKYIYSNVNYIDSRTKINIICPKHGIFKQIPNSHLNGRGCPKCSGKYKSNVEEFIKKAKDVHGNKYDYSLVEYINSKIKIKIICSKHGEFKQIPNSHLNGRGCSKCKVEKMIDEKRLTTKIFIEKANLIHDNKYDYSLINYENNHVKVKIICSEHGEFKQTPNAHLTGQGCPKCAGKYMDTEYFIEKAKLIHGEKYDYSLVDYFTNKSKVIIICNKHGNFLQTPCDHLSGCGCPTCKQSSGERKIGKFLDDNNIKYVVEKIFDGCKNKMCLPFDFYLPKYNVLIEYDGIQHFEAANFYGGKHRFVERQKIDNIKTEFAAKNGYNLIRIAYNENIEEKLIAIL